MSRFGEEVKKIVEVVGLSWAPIAGKFLVDNGGAGDSALKLSICEAFDVVKRGNVVLCLSKETCVCPGGRHFAGLEIAPLEAFAPALTSKKHRVYESIDTALESISKQPQPVKRGNFFKLGPLEKFESDPDLVFLFVNPAQADRVLGLISFKGAEPFMYYPASSICSTITNVLAKGSPEINLISTFERRADKWSPNELILAMPLNDFKEAVANIPNSGYGTFELQSGKPPSNSKS
ncbi:MAG: DUF169 domain-containing protein [Candidatus Bathyarchaeia archaeon]|jgi:uncharacterized protein (DUF169 family)